MKHFMTLESARKKCRKQAKIDCWIVEQSSYHSRSPKDYETSYLDDMEAA